MARIRTIKPEIWTDEKLSECSLSAHLLFIGLISFADDEGRMEFAPARIRMQIFPCGRVPPKKLTELFGELSERSLIRIYTIESRDYLDIPGFIKHQKINRPTPSKLPPFYADDAHIHGVLSEFSLSPHAGMERKGRERREERETRARPSKRCPLDFSVTHEMRTWASKNAPAINLEAETETFREFEFARAYTDWPATWRRWIKRATSNGATNGTHRSANKPRLSAVERVYQATADVIGDDGDPSRKRLAIDG